MTSEQLYEKLTPYKTDKYFAQLLSDGLSVNLSDAFSKLIKDAARCNGYNSDVYYDLRTIDTAMKEFDPHKEFTPIWIGFRKLGVDGTSYILCKADNEAFYGSLSANYFALYSLTVENDHDDFYHVVLNEYTV